MDLSKLGRGINLFNRGEFFDSHEVLEEVWQAERGDQRLFLQALIHVAVGMHHWERSNRLGAGRQFDKGLRKLERFLPGYAGVDTLRLHRDLTCWRERVRNGEERPRASIATIGAGP